MKLRVRGNSLRLRISKPEVLKLAQGLRVSERVSFGPSGFLDYSLVPSEGAPLPSDDKALYASFEGGEVRVTVRGDIAREWARSEAVSLEAEQPVGEGERLSILVEKDFHCLNPRARPEDERELFPNPNQGKGCG